MPIPLTCPYCGQVTGKHSIGDTLGTAVYTLNEHTDPRDCIRYLAQQVRELRGDVGDLMDHTGFGETDDPRENGWVGDDGLP